MQKAFLSAVLVSILSLALSPVQATPALQKQEAASKAETAKESNQAAKTSSKSKITGRLPRYFGKVVDDSQRKQIYKIQAEYREKVSALQLQLTQMKQAELKAIEGVLEPSQLDRLNKLRSDAMQRSTVSKQSSVVK